MERSDLNPKLLGQLSNKELCLTNIETNVSFNNTKSKKSGPTVNIITIVVFALSLGMHSWKTVVHQHIVIST